MLYRLITVIIISTCLFTPLYAPGDKSDRGMTHQTIDVKFDNTIELNTPIVALQPVEPAEPEGRWVTAVVTAYSPHARSCGRWSALGKTSTGVSVRTIDPDKAYGIAADPKVIPYGTSIYVPGYWESLQNNKNLIPTEMTKVDDTGGDMRKSARKGIIHIDIRFRTQSAAVKWGKKTMEIFIYE